ncbi:hypothetical protein A1A1_19041, partial [Planococcus antarcticus DSM 14505]
MLERLKRLEGLAAGVWTPTSAGSPFRFDRHKTDQQCGVLCHAAGLAYDPRIWAPESGHRQA